MRHDEKIISCDIWGSHRVADEDSGLTGCNAVLTGKQLLTIQGQGVQEVSLELIGPEHGSTRLL